MRSTPSEGPNTRSSLTGSMYPALVILSLVTAASPTRAQQPDTRLLIVTGGHDFEREPFFEMFDSLEGCSWREAQHPNANHLYTEAESAAYDVLVLYDMNQAITETQKAEFLAMLERGKGLVILHHAFADYQGWEAFEKIRGGTYFLAPRERDGLQLPASTFRHGVDIPVELLAPWHPVLEGLSDFTIHDEVYGLTICEPDINPLLGTDHPESNATIAWTNEYGNSRIVTIQLGHDHFAYENPNYRKLLSNAIHWVHQKQ